MRMRRCTAVVLAATAVLLGLQSCSGNENDENVILPTSARLEVNAVATDPVVFLRQSPGDTSNADDVVIVDVVLRHTGTQTYRDINLELLFNPGVIQVGQVDLTATPLGNCAESPTNTCTPVCIDNVNPEDPMTPSANESGDLILGVSPRGSVCPGTTVNGEQKLLSIAFIGASVGTSPLTLVDGAGSGDCEILDGPPPTSLNIPCDDGGATITVAR